MQYGVNMYVHLIYSMLPHVNYISFTRRRRGNLIFCFVLFCLASHITSCEEGGCVYLLYLKTETKISRYFQLRSFSGR